MDPDFENFSSSKAMRGECPKNSKFWQKRENRRIFFFFFLTSIIIIITVVVVVVVAVVVDFWPLDDSTTLIVSHQFEFS